MGILHAPHILDRTPALLGATADLPEIASQAIGIGTIGAVQHIGKVELHRVPDVKDQAIAAPSFSIL